MLNKNKIHCFVVNIPVEGADGRIVFKCRSNRRDRGYLWITYLDDEVPDSYSSEYNYDVK